MVMDKAVFLAKLEEMMEIQSGTLADSESLKNLKQWDSVAIMGFIAFVDEHFEITLSAKRLVGCKTVDDLIALLGDRIMK
jgi:acyl carrier protein